MCKKLSGSNDDDGCYIFCFWDVRERYIVHRPVIVCSGCTVLLSWHYFFLTHLVGTRSQHQVRHGLFLVDSSVYRTTSEFLAQVEFIKSIAKRLDVSPNGTRAGVILYGSDPQLSIGLSDYGTFLEFYTLLDNLTWQGGEHQLHKVNKQAFVCLFVLFFMNGWVKKMIAQIIFCCL